MKIQLTLKISDNIFKQSLTPNRQQLSVKMQKMSILLFQTLRLRSVNTSFKLELYGKIKLGDREILNQVLEDTIYNYGSNSKGGVIQFLSSVTIFHIPPQHTPGIHRSIAHINQDSGCFQQSSEQLISVRTITH